MGKKQSTKEKNNKIKLSDEFLELIICWIFVILVLLMLHPVIFDFSKIPVWHKVIMIIGTIVLYVSIIIIIRWFESILKNRKEKKTKERAQVRFAYFICLLCVVYFSLGYFSQDIWGSLPIASMIINLAIILVGSYLFVKDHFSFLLNKEKFPMVILAIGLFCLQLALMLNMKGKVADIFIKVGVGIVYLEVIAIFINLTILREKIVNSKHVVMYLILCISIPVAVLTTIPYYVQWCGLTGEDYKTFVSVYAALIGGGLTLVGVAWTIRKGDKDRKNDLERRDKERVEEERKRFVPYIRLVRGVQACCFVNASVQNSIEYRNLPQNHFFTYVINDFNIKNISESIIYLHGVGIDNKYFSFSYDNVIEKDAICQIQTTGSFEYSSAEPLKSLSIFIGDAVGNKYEIACNITDKPEGCIEIYTEQDEKYTSFRSEYSVENLSLPRLLEKETK